jgi:hypothetical protein
VANASDFPGEYTNIGNMRVRHDDVDPDVETSAIIVEQPSGYVFNDGLVPGVSVDHDDNQLYHRVTGVPLTTPASFVVFVNGLTYEFLDDWYTGADGHADPAEAAVDAILNP